MLCNCAGEVKLVNAKNHERFFTLISKKLPLGILYLSNVKEIFYEFMTVQYFKMRARYFCVISFKIFVKMKRKIINTLIYN
jgi:hypothetical protein